jgi:GH25 family lysozyme M1 (1,4-beta-N-acetylmuramidase)
MTLLIDRSNNNGADSYAEAKKAGVTHAYFKASDGTGFVDSTYKDRMARAHAAGIICGAYHFAEHGSPVAEATHFLSVIGTPAAGHMRPCLDLESGESAAWAAAFVEHLHAKLGYYPVLYGNTSTIPALRSASAAVRACPWWRAEFGPNDGTRHALQGGDMGASAHQYTSTAHVPGIEGATDASVFLAPAATMLVPATRPKWRRPKSVTVHWVGGDGKPRSREFRGLGWFQFRHPRAWWRGAVTSKPNVKK